MDNSTIALKPVKDLLGMNFFIPDYQRGYRWTERQALDLLNDIWIFADNNSSADDEIYCIQPLVVQQKTDNKLLENIRQAANVAAIKELLKGSWNVVDGQQRLTTIYLILLALNIENRYAIEYQTRKGSKAFLEDISEAAKNDNIDYYHIYNVYATIKQWLNGQDLHNREKFKDALLNKVNFIWYQIKDETADDDRAEAIAAFTRLNIGKIPLTDSELIKALFLNRSNFDCNDIELEKEQLNIATEWDEIEFALQNDEFWLFLHSPDYEKPTRIDFILDMIQERDEFSLRKDVRNFRGQNRIEAKDHNEFVDKQIGDDEHKTFRYFYYAFHNNGEAVNTAWIRQKWAEVRKYFQIFNEWYSNYKLYHYIGYLTTVCERKGQIGELVDEWLNKPVRVSRKKSAEETEIRDPSKNGFLEAVRRRIYDTLPQDENHKLIDLDNFVFDEPYNGETVSKRACVPILLLHNVETIIQQNDKLVTDKRYSLPNFTKFPFHLYKKENWEVEHIRPNAGDKIHSDDARKVYAILAKMYLGNNNNLANDIDEYLSGNMPFDDLLEKILAQDHSIPENAKNKIWNYALLDGTTNKEYGNMIFPIKRAFVANKERGFKIRYGMKNGQITKSDPIPEIAFVPPCTRNVFAKFYTEIPEGMLEWTETDANNYLSDIKEKLKDYRNFSGGNNHA